jgi:hypothetical protein
MDPDPYPGSGFGRPKNMQILWIRIGNTDHCKMVDFAMAASQNLLAPKL